MDVYRNDTAQHARHGAERQLRENQPGPREISADHSENEVGEHDGEKPRNQPFQPAFFAPNPEETAEENGKRLDTLIDGFNDGIGEIGKFEDKGKDKHGRKAEQNREQNGLGDLYQMGSKRIFRLHNERIPPR